MRRVASLAVFLVAVGACAPTTQERVRQHSQDGAHLFGQGSFAGARDCFQSALNLQPDDPDLVYNLGRCHDRMGQLDLAERLYRQCLERNPDHLEALHACVVLMRNSGRKDMADALVGDWRRKRPDLAGPCVEEGWLLVQAGDPDRAMYRYRQALDRDPLQPRALIELAALYEKRGRPERALVLYERALVAQPDQPAITRLVSELRGRGVGKPHPD